MEHTIICRTWDDLPDRIQQDRTYDISNLDPALLTKYKKISIMSERNLRIIGDPRKTYGNLTLLLNGASTLHVVSLHLRGDTDRYVTIIRNNGNRISAEGCNSFVMQDNTAAILLDREATLSIISSESPESRLTIVAGITSKNNKKGWDSVDY